MQDVTRTSPEPQPGILDISPYVAGKSHADGANEVTKLSSNENPLGPSPAAKNAVREAAETLELYPSSDHAGLRAAIARVHGLDAARIICGAGSDEVIAFLCNAYAGPGTEVIHTEHGFAMYRISALAAGATPVEVPEKARTLDAEAILAAVTPSTRLVFLANPNNPTGTMVASEVLEALAAALPETCLLVIDSAYSEYVEGYDGGAALVDAHPNVVMTRTFSKIYGLGALRIGWGYASAEIIDVLNRIRGPFNVSAPALVAAEAAVEDQGYVIRCRQANAQWRGWMVQEFRALGLSVDEPFANFVVPRFASREQAEACEAHLRSHGILVRLVAGYNLPEALRITVGDEIACRKVVSLIGEFLKQTS
ncbi:histidinol-phosphate transaminase [Algicella marina]|uniref:Histidinol-phosphate aminotransferase n=1 Tax=Algicella marina TaxID=2683284 RepID=A0A6P1T3G9_9RHOB|nr:histidinol-phosphate transaminase [Algicella marina]QHQ36223.1 histidinol-phosphate transaminase [Algicella marina]